MIELLIGIALGIAGTYAWTDAMRQNAKLEGERNKLFWFDEVKRLRIQVSNLIGKEPA